MDKSEMARAVAGYVAGDKISRDALESAVRMLDHPRTIQIAIEAFRNAPPLVSEREEDACFAFRDALLDFAMLPGNERIARMPRLHAHLQACNECTACLRETIAIVRGDLLAAAADSESGRSLWTELRPSVEVGSYVLSVPLQLLITAGRRLRSALELDTQFAQPAFQASVMKRGGEDRASTEHDDFVKQWRIREPTLGTSFLFRMTPSHGGDAIELTIKAETLPFKNAERLTLRLKSDRSEDEMSTTWNCTEDCSLEITPGDWTLSISCSAPEDHATWAIRLEIRKEK